MLKRKMLKYIKFFFLQIWSILHPTTTFTEGLLNIGTGCPGKWWESPILEVFKRNVDMALRDHRGPSQTKQFLRIRDGGSVSLWAQVAERHPVSQGLAWTVTWSLLLKILSQLFLSAARFCTDTRGLFNLWLRCMLFDPLIRKPKAFNQVSRSLFPIKPGKTSEDLIEGRGGDIVYTSSYWNFKAFVIRLFLSF